MLVVNFYSLIYSGNYEHTLFMKNKGDSLRSHIEAKGGDVSETLLRAYDLEEFTLNKTQSIVSAEKMQDESITHIHEKTHNRWNKEHVSDNEIAERFSLDLLEKLKSNSKDEIARNIADVMCGKATPIIKNVEIGL